jgi:hypothetical protein
MFSPKARDDVRANLLEVALRDTRLTGGAITGSGASGKEDAWSDIDLAFAVAEPADIPTVVSDWTEHMYQAHGALHHMDVVSGAWLYRVFLLPDTLQVDLAFCPASDFRALAPSFKLVFGAAQASRHVAPRRTTEMIGWGWLYALHARSSISRKKFWQAEYMISGMRDTALAMACARHGLSTAHGRGIDELPATFTSHFEAGLIGNLNEEALSGAFRVVARALLSEIECADADIANRLRPVLMCLTTSP